MQTDDAFIPEEELFTAANYAVDSFADELRVDDYCRRLLKLFHADLQEEKKLAPLTAGAHARAADYFLRDFAVDHLRKNPFSLGGKDIRAFAGNWYIVSTLEANLAELQDLLAGTLAFYQYCAEKKLISAEKLQAFAAAGRDISFYRERIDAFHALRGDEYDSWNRVCPDR